MKDPQIKRMRIIGVRFTRKEFESIQEKSRQSTSPQLSEFIRRCVFDKPMVIKHRNQSLDDAMHQLMELQKEFNALSNNFNQSVRVLNTFKTAPAVDQFVKLYEVKFQQLFSTVHQIQQRITKMSDLWLQ